MLYTLHMYSGTTIRFGVRDYKHTSTLRIACDSDICTASYGGSVSNISYIVERSKNKHLYDQLKPFACEEPPFPLHNLTQDAFASTWPPQVMHCWGTNGICDVTFGKSMFLRHQYKVQYNASWLRR